MTVPESREGYTLVEVIVALMLFTVGALALMSTSTVLATQLGNDARRERAARIAADRLETLRAGCRAAASGSEQVSDVRSSWSVARVTANQVGIVEVVSYLAWRGSRTDTLRALVPCA